MKGSKGITGELALKKTVANPQPFPDPFVKILGGVVWGLGRGEGSFLQKGPFASPIS